MTDEQEAILKKAQALIKEIAELEDEEQNIINDFIGEWLTFEQAELQLQLLQENI